MASSNKVICGWKHCQQEFGDEIDMNLHMLAKHMVLLDYGRYIMDRRAKAETPIRSTVQPRFNPQYQLMEHVEPTSSSNIRPNNYQVYNQDSPGCSSSHQQVELKQEDLVPEEEIFDDIFHLETKPRHEDMSLSHGALLPSSPADYDVEIDEHQPGISQNHHSSQSNGKYQQPTDDLFDFMNAKDMGSEIRMAAQRNPEKFRQILDKFLQRAVAAKRLGYNRPEKPFYCMVCMKFNRTKNICGLRHTPEENEFVNMYRKKFGGKPPGGKQELVNNLTEIKSWLAADINLSRSEMLSHSSEMPSGLEN